MGANVELTGMDALLSRVEQMGLNISKVEGDALRAAALPVLEDAILLVPVVSGTLKKNLKIGAVKNKNGLKYVRIGDVDYKVPYSYFVEYGRSSARAHPFLGPAYERNKQNIIKILQSTIEEALK